MKFWINLLERSGTRKIFRIHIVQEDYSETTSFVRKMATMALHVIHSVVSWYSFARNRLVNFSHGKLLWQPFRIDYAKRKNLKARAWRETFISPYSGVLFFRSTPFRFATSLPPGRPFWAKKKKKRKTHSYHRLAIILD